MNHDKEWRQLESDYMTGMADLAAREQWEMLNSFEAQS